MRFHTDAEGWTTAYRRRAGVGPPLLFLNALGSDQSIWDGVIAALPRGRAVLTCDLPGHGLSPAAPEPPTIAGIAAAMLRWLDAQDVGPVIPCGLSVGGMIAQGMAAAAPDRCAALVLVCTAPVIGTAARWNDRIAQPRALALPIEATMPSPPPCAVHRRTRRRAAMGVAPHATAKHGMVVSKGE